ncbi:hypothetical protein JCM10908_007043 [Rhodotorula pacifica]|uniref:uncharacterized protein n=1 Tax=Rhodotorula pacifica TaxID=1495444 RepID=UPI003178FFAA
MATMATMASEQVEMTPTGTLTATTSRGSTVTLQSAAEAPDEAVFAAPADTKEAFESYPDAGVLAWTQVASAFALMFTTMGGVYSWGVFQDALVGQGLAPSSTLAFIGSTQVSLEAIFAIPIGRLVGAFGPRRVAIVGSLFTGLGPILAGSFTGNFAALLVFEGLMYGLGAALCFFSVATLPAQYFLRRRNLTTGLVYSGSGLGGAVFSIITSRLLQRVSLAWTFRIIGLLMTAINLPAALTLKARAAKQPLRREGKGQAIDRGLFKDVGFLLLLVGTAVAIFPLFVPPFFLPLYGTSIGLSATTSSFLLAGYNLSSAAGRIGFGLGADALLGSLNSLCLCLLFVAFSTLLIWPFATSIAPLIIFAIINGLCAGGMFSLTPGTVGSIFGSRRLPVVFSMIVSSWAPGYFVGAPIAGYILQAYGGPDRGAGAYRPAIFYAGALSLLSAACIITLRGLQSRNVWQKM